MRLDFNVLWVDDQPASVESQIAAIEKQMKDEGFNFTPTLCGSVEEVKGEVASDVFSDEVDLILVDWDLGAASEGQNAIAEIRQSAPYKDIVFYSAQTSPEKLRALAFEAGVEGIYCVARDDLVSEVVGVFDSLVKKVLDLDHSRGIVMGATSDIDHLVKECLRAMHDQLDEEGKEALVSDMLERIDTRRADVSRTAEDLRAKVTLDRILESGGILTANDYLRVLSTTLKMPAFRMHTGSRQAVIEYIRDVVPGRNRLAHQVRDANGRPRQVTDERGEQLSLEEVRDLRRRILNLRSEFTALLTALNS